MNPTFPMLFLAFTGVSQYFTAADASPEQIHLALGGAPIKGTIASSGMYINFYDDQEAEGVPVRYGVNSAFEDGGTVTSKSSQYLKDHGYHHSALIEGLPCNIDEICYQIEGDAATR